MGSSTAEGPAEGGGAPAVNRLNDCGGGGGGSAQ